MLVELDVLHTSTAKSDQAEPVRPPVRQSENLELVYYVYTTYFIVSIYAVQAQESDTPPYCDCVCVIVCVCVGRKGPSCMSTSNWTYFDTRS